MIDGVVFYNRTSASIPTKIPVRKATGFDCQSYQGLSKDLHQIDNSKFSRQLLCRYLEIKLCVFIRLGK